MGKDIVMFNSPRLVDFGLTILYLLNSKSEDFMGKSLG